MNKLCLAIFTKQFESFCFDTYRHLNRFKEQLDITMHYAQEVRMVKNSLNVEGYTFKNRKRLFLKEYIKLLDCNYSISKSSYAYSSFFDLLRSGVLLALNISFNSTYIKKIFVLFDYISIYLYGVQDAYVKREQGLPMKFFSNCHVSLINGTLSCGGTWNVFFIMPTLVSMERLSFEEMVSILKKTPCHELYYIDHHVLCINENCDMPT